jgi:hypothetical protein
MATQVEICNMALGLLGAENITSINDNTKEAKTCLTYYANTKLHLLRSHNWNFAMKRASVTGVTGVLFEYKYKIQLPADCLRIVSFYDYTDTFKEEGGYVLLNQQTVKIKYVRNDVTESSFDSSFAMCFASKLADMMSYQIAQSSTLTQLVQARHREDLAQARRNNAISNSPDSFQEPVFITTRL